ncbi:cytochrome c [Polaribacter batillariae]|uniref:Cytochrome c n=1 Tax=Polaribacter batillariae TaxID=2808900 RepID=A0ABX7SVU8_9FLAO|nr:cytochrome c [Polaribacter batillariae]QTD38377.1 cytochrome c [Polaribacter batillariae]
MKKKATIIFVGFLLLSLTIGGSSCKNVSKEEQELVLKQSIKRGAKIYNDMCKVCHLPSGEGQAKIYPPLAKSDYLMQKREASIRAIKYGLNGKIVVNGITYNKRMAKLGLDNDEVADVMNYITNAWGNKNDKMITEKEVEKISKK